MDKSFLWNMLNMAETQNQTGVLIFANHDNYRKCEWDLESWSEYFEFELKLGMPSNFHLHRVNFYNVPVVLVPISRSFSIDTIVSKATDMCNCLGCTGPCVLLPEFKIYKS